MSGDFDFLSDTDDRQPPRTRRDRDEPDARPARRPERAGPRRADPDDEPAPRAARPAPAKGEPKKRGPGLLIAALAGAGVLVVGGAVAIVLVARGSTKLPEPPPDKPPPTPVVTQPAKKEAGDPNAPSAEVIQKVKKATVLVLVQFEDGKTASGSGFVEKQTGMVITNAHVVGLLEGKRPPTIINLIVNSGEGKDKEYPLEGEVEAVDRENDLALIRPSLIMVGERHVVPEGLTVPKAVKLAETQRVFVFGFPLGTDLGREMTVSETSITSLRKDDSGRLAKIQVKGGMAPGNSGGPVVDLKGNVVGVAVSGIRNTEFNFAIHGELVTAFLAKKRKG